MEYLSSFFLFLLKVIKFDDGCWEWREKFDCSAKILAGPLGQGRRGSDQGGEAGNNPNLDPRAETEQTEHQHNETGLRPNDKGQEEGSIFIS